MTRSSSGSSWFTHGEPRGTGRTNPCERRTFFTLNNPKWSSEDMEGKVSSLNHGNKQKTTQHGSFRSFEESLTELKHRSVDKRCSHSRPEKQERLPLCIETGRERTERGVQAKTQHHLLRIQTTFRFEKRTRRSTPTSRSEILLHRCGTRETVISHTYQRGEKKLKGERL